MLPFVRKVIVGLIVSGLLALWVGAFFTYLSILPFLVFIVPFGVASALVGYTLRLRDINPKNPLTLLWPVGTGLAFVAAAVTLLPSASFVLVYGTLSVVLGVWVCSTQMNLASPTPPAPPSPPRFGV